MILSYLDYSALPIKVWLMNRAFHDQVLNITLEFNQALYLATTYCLPYIPVKIINFGK